MQAIEVEKLTTIGARVTEDEKELFVQLAKINRRSQSQFIRDLIRDSAKSLGMWPPSGAAPAGGVKC